MMVTTPEFIRESCEGWVAADAPERKGRVDNPQESIDRLATASPFAEKLFLPVALYPDLSPFDPILRCTDTFKRKRRTHYLDQLPEERAEWWFSREPRFVPFADRPLLQAAGLSVYILRIPNDLD